MACDCVQSVTDEWSPSALSESGLLGAATGIFHSDKPSLEYLLHVRARGSSWFQQAGEVTFHLGIL